MGVAMNIVGHGEGVDPKFQTPTTKVFAYFIYGDVWLKVVACGFEGWR